MAGYIIKYKGKKYINFDGFRETTGLDPKTALARVSFCQDRLTLCDRVFFLLEEDFNNSCSLPIQDFDYELSKFSKVTKKDPQDLVIKIGENSKVYSFDKFRCVLFKEVKYNDKYNKIKYFPIIKVEGNLYVLLRTRHKKDGHKTIVCDVSTPLTDIVEN